MTPVRGQASDEAAVSAISGEGPGGRVSDASLGLGHAAGVEAGRLDGSAVDNWVDKTMRESPRP